MKLSVSSKNEYKFYPDIMDNLEKEEKDRFAIVVKKVNTALSSSDWFNFDKDGKFNGVSNKNKLKAYVKRLDNAPNLEIDAGEERLMTVEDLFSEEFPELYDITIALNTFVIKLEETGKKETKKL